MTESPGKWQSRLMNHVASIKESNIRAFVQSNDVKPENYVSTLKKFFGQNQMMSSLWAELKRQRQGADVTIQQAWTELVMQGPSSSEDEETHLVEYDDGDARQVAVAPHGTRG